MHEIADKKFHTVKVFYTFNSDGSVGVGSAYPRDMPRPDYSEGPKLYEQNVLLARTIIQKLDNIDQNHQKSEEMRNK